MACRLRCRSSGRAMPRMSCCAPAAPMNRSTPSGCRPDTGKGTVMKTIEATSFLTASAEDWETAVEIGNRHYVATAGEAVLKLLASQKDDPKQGWQVNNYQ